MAKCWGRSRLPWGDFFSRLRIHCWRAEHRHPNDNGRDGQYPLPANLSSPLELLRPGMTVNGHCHLPRKTPLLQADAESARCQVVYGERNAALAGHSINQNSHPVPTLHISAVYHRHPNAQPRRAIQLTVMEQRGGASGIRRPPSGGRRAAPIELGQFTVKFAAKFMESPWSGSQSQKGFARRSARRPVPFGRSICRSALPRVSGAQVVPMIIAQDQETDQKRCRRKPIRALGQQQRECRTEQAHRIRAARKAQTLRAGAIPGVANSSASRAQ